MHPVWQPVRPDDRRRSQDVRDATEILRMLTGDEPDGWTGCSADPEPLEHCTRRPGPRRGASPAVRS